MNERFNKLEQRLDRIERKIDYFANQFAVRRKPIINKDGNFQQEIIMLDTLINNKIDLQDGKDIDDKVVTVIIENKNEKENDNNGKF
jgi:hypothetical protein